MERPSGPGKVIPIRLNRLTYRKWKEIDHSPQQTVEQPEQPRLLAVPLVAALVLASAMTLVGVFGIGWLPIAAPPAPAPPSAAWVYNPDTMVWRHHPQRVDGVEISGNTWTAGSSMGISLAPTAPAATCTVGEQFYDSASQKILACSAANTWISANPSTGTATKAEYVDRWSAVELTSSVTGNIPAGDERYSITPGPATLNWKVFRDVKGPPIAEGALSLSTSTIKGGACGPEHAVIAAGVVATDAIDADFSTINIPIGYEDLVIYKYASSGTANFKVCNRRGPPIRWSGAATCASITSTGVIADSGGSCSSR